MYVEICLYLYIVPKILCIHSLPAHQLQAPDLSQHSMVEILHEFAQICISAAVRHGGVSSYGDYGYLGDL